MRFSMARERAGVHAVRAGVFARRSSGDLAEAAPPGIAVTGDDVARSGCAVSLCRVRRVALFHPALADVFSRHQPHHTGASRAFARRGSHADNVRRRAIFAWHVRPATVSRSSSTFTAMAARCVIASRASINSSPTASAFSRSISRLRRSSGSPSTRPDRRRRSRYAFAAARYSVSQIVVWGESLGTGVAVALAAEKPSAG